MNPENNLFSQKNKENICAECGDFIPNHFLTCSQFSENIESKPGKEIIAGEKNSNDFFSPYKKEKEERIEYFANQLNLKIIEEIEPLIGSRKELPDEKEKKKIKLILEKIISQALNDAPPTLFKEIFSKIISFIIFLFAAFYFLKEGGGMIDRLLNLVPNRYKIEVDILLKKINSILGSYLRGQIFLVILVSLVLFICLTIIGVKFALMVAIFSGIAEIVPIIGPILAAGVAASVAYLGGTSNFGLDPLQTAVIVIIVYTVVRQIQDYLVNPQIMGRITKLHPLIILFAVIAGEHVAGITGLLLAVPIAGVLKLIVEYSLELIEDKEIEAKYK